MCGPPRPSHRIGTAVDRQQHYFGFMVVAECSLTDESVHAICAETDEDEWTDWTDFLSLIANLLILISGPVYLILDNPSDGMDAHGRARGETAEDDAETARLVLQVISLTAVIATCVIGMVVWVKVWRELTGDVDEGEHAGAFCVALYIHLKLPSDRPSDNCVGVYLFTCLSRRLDYKVRMHMRLLDEKRAEIDQLEQKTDELRHYRGMVEAEKYKMRSSSASKAVPSSHTDNPLSAVGSGQ